MSQSATKKCPYCAEEIKAEAIRCRYCQVNLVDPPGGSQGPLRQSQVAFLIAGVLLIGVLVLPGLFAWSALPLAVVFLIAGYRYRRQELGSSAPPIETIAEAKAEGRVEELTFRKLGLLLAIAGAVFLILLWFFLRADSRKSEVSAGKGVAAEVAVATKTDTPSEISPEEEARRRAIEAQHAREVADLVEQEQRKLEEEARAREQQEEQARLDEAAADRGEAESNREAEERATAAAKLRETLRQKQAEADAALLAWTPGYRARLRPLLVAMRDSSSAMRLGNTTVAADACQRMVETVPAVRETQANCPKAEIKEAVGQALDSIMTAATACQEGHFTAGQLRLMSAFEVLPR